MLYNLIEARCPSGRRYVEWGDGKADMVQAADFELHALQAAAITARAQFRSRSVLPLALDAFGDIYDGEPVVLPLPEEERELPFIILVSQDGGQRMQVARERVDFVWERRGDGAGDLGRLLTEFADRLAAIAEREKVQIGRLAVVANRVTRLPHPGRVLAQQYIRERWLSGPSGPLNRPEGFEIHAHKVFTLIPSLQVNSWMRIRTDQLVGQAYQGIRVDQDINTLEQERSQREFDRESMRQFFAAVGKEINHILGLYFPAE